MKISLPAVRLSRAHHAFIAARLGLMVLMAGSCLVRPLAALAQSALLAPLPPTAQEALNKGIIAAQQQEYLLAIRYFQDARKASPAAPVLLFNLGLADSKIPGRELRAMAWFGAYLAASPGVPNAASVKGQIAELEVRNQINISRLLTSLQAAASQLSDKGGDQSSALWQAAGLWLDSGDLVQAQKVADLIRFADFKTRVLTSIAEARVTAGDMTGAKNSFASAQKSAELIDTQPSFGLESAGAKKSQRLAAIARAQAKGGDIAAAQRSADLIKSERASDRVGALTAIAEAQAKAGDSAGAQKTLAAAEKIAELIVEWPYGKRYAQSAIAEAQINAGDIAGAQRTLAATQKTAELIDEPQYKVAALSDIAEAQAKIGDIPAALKTLTAAQGTSDLIKDAAYKSIARTSIAEAQTKAGDIAGARKSLLLAQDFANVIPGQSYGKSRAQSALAEAQARSGNIADAQKNADLVEDADLKSQAKRTISEMQAKAEVGNARQPSSPLQSRPAVKVTDWLGKLDDSDEKSDCPLNTTPFLDLASYLKSLPPSNDPAKVFEALYNVAEKMVKAQNVVSGLLNQGAKR